MKWSKGLVVYVAMGLGDDESGQELLEEARGEGFHLIGQLREIVTQEDSSDLLRGLDGGKRRATVPAAEGDTAPRAASLAPLN